MDFKAILKKMLAGKELSAEEKTFMESYDLDKKDENKIPKTRLDTEIQKRKDFEKQVETLNKTIEEIQGKLDEKEESDLSEIDKLKKAHKKEIDKLTSENKSLTSERDTANTELSGMKFKASVSKLAADHNFKSTEYLAYLVKEKGEDFNFEDKDACSAFMEGLKKEIPDHFTVKAKPGASSTVDGKEINDKFVEAKDKGDINAMLANAPEITE